MSDFLDHLIVRSFARVETVQPQIVSLFAPAPVSSGSVFQVRATPELPMAEPQVETLATNRLDQAQALWAGQSEQSATSFEPLMFQTRAESQEVSFAVRQDRAQDEPVMSKPTPPSEASIQAKLPSRPPKGGSAKVPSPGTKDVVEPNRPNVSKSRTTSPATNGTKLRSFPRAGVAFHLDRSEESLIAKPIERVSASTASEPNRPPGPLGFTRKELVETPVRKRRLEPDVTAVQEAQPRRPELKPHGPAPSHAPNRSSAPGVDCSGADRCFTSTPAISAYSRSGEQNAICLHHDWPRRSAGHNAATRACPTATGLGTGNEFG